MVGILISTFLLPGFILKLNFTFSHMLYKIKFAIQILTDPNPNGLVAFRSFKAFGYFWTLIRVPQHCYTINSYKAGEKYRKGKEHLMVLRLEGENAFVGSTFIFSGPRVACKTFLYKARKGVFLPVCPIRKDCFQIRIRLQVILDPGPDPNLFPDPGQNQIFYRTQMKEIVHII